jgi:release factor glutamine methyltransferase
MKMEISKLLYYIADAVISVSDEPMHEARTILRYILNTTDTDISTASNLYISPTPLRKIKKIIEKRKQNIPLAQILGEKYFYNHNFIVSQDTLIPRQETELLVDLCYTQIKKKIYDMDKINILEIGAGTGCVGLSVIKECLSNLKNPNSQKRKLVFLQTEISKKSFTICKSNALSILQNDISNYQENPESLYCKVSNKHLEIEYMCKLANCIPKYTKRKFDIVISNPPYIPTKLIPTLPQDVQREPRLALDGGETGIEVTIGFIEKVLNHINPKAVIIFEIHSESTQILHKEIKKFTNKKITLIKDLTGKNRFIKLLT